MHKNTLIKILQWGLVGLIVATPLFYLREGVYPYIFSKTLFFQAIVEILFGFWLVLAYSHKEFRPKNTPILWSGIFFFGVMVVTAMLGVDFVRSFWSTQERMLGIFTWLHIFALFVILQSCTRVVPWKKVMTASLVTAIFVSFLAFAQLWFPNLLLNEAVGDRPGATFGNPTFFAGYLLAHIFLCICTLLKNSSNGGQNKNENYTILAFLFVFGIALLNTQTRGDIAGLGLGFLAMVMWFAIFPPVFQNFKKINRKVYVAVSIFAIVVATLFYFTRSASFWQLVPGLSRIATTSFNDTDTIPRRAAWSAAWQGFKEHPLKGVGWENFNTVFNAHYNPEVLQLGYQETRFDKPHNTWLEYLVTGGAPLFLAYLAVSLILLYVAYKTGNRVLAGVVAGAIVAYHIRSFVVFDTLGPVFMVALFAAYIDGLWMQKNSQDAHQAVKSKKYEESPSWGVVGLCVGVFLIPAYIINYQSGLASYYQFYGFTNFVKNKFPQAIESFRNANTIWSPYDWNLQRDYARATAEAYFYNPGRVPKEEAVYAVSQMEEAVKAHPNDAVTHGILVDLYNQINDINPKEYAKLAEEHGARALELSPNRQEVYFSLSKTKTLEKDYKGALALLDKALSLAPNIPDSHFYYGLVAYADNQQELGYAHIKKAIDLGRKWKNNNEPRVVANFFADSGHLDEAIDLYKKALELKKDDTDARLKLAVAYFTKGDKEKARETMQEVIKEFDITKSPSYQDILPILQNLGL